MEPKFIETPPKPFRAFVCMVCDREVTKAHAIVTKRGKAIETEYVCDPCNNDCRQVV